MPECQADLLADAVESGDARYIAIALGLKLAFTAVLQAPTDPPDR